jgi:hypothetical protein
VQKHKYHKRNTEALLEAKREVGIVVNTEKAKYTVIFRCQNAGEIHNLMIANKSFENVTNFKYLGKAIKNKNYIHEEIKSRLISRNVSYHSVQSLLSFHLLSKKPKD